LIAMIVLDGAGDGPAGSVGQGQDPAPFGQKLHPPDPCLIHRFRAWLAEDVIVGARTVLTALRRLGQMPSQASAALTAPLRALLVGVCVPWDAGRDAA
jgi:hypothetical protein